MFTIWLLNLLKAEISRGDIMAFTKITENDTINKGVIGLPDTPNLSTAAMQAKFEELSNDVIIPKFNNLVDELEAKSAAGNTGATIPSGINAVSENVQAVLNGIAEKAHTHEKSDAELTDAVTKAHEHSNKSVIDKFTENESGVPLYNGRKMTGDAFKTVKVGTTSIVATDYDTIEIIAGDNVVIDADEVNKTLKFSAIGGSGGGGGDMYKAVYDKNNDGMVDDAKTVGSLDLLNTTNKTNAVTAINEVLQDHTEFVDHGSLYSTNTETFKDLESGFYRLRNYKSDLFPGSVAVTGTMQKNVVGGHHTGTIITTDGVNYTRFADYDSSGTLVSDTGWKKMSVDTLTTMEQVEASTDDSKAVGAGAVKELSSSIGDISNVGNTTYNSVEKILQYYIDNGYLPDLKSMALIPVMTSNTTPSGVVSAISEYSISPAYYAFRNLYDDTTNTECWQANDSKGTSHSNLWLMYKFPEAVTVKKFRIRYVYTSAVNYKIQGSNDGNTFVDLGTFTTITGEEQIQNTNAYLYYRLLITTQTTSSPNVFGGCVRDLQLYGY